MEIFQTDTQVAGLSILFILKFSAYDVLDWIGSSVDDPLEFQKTSYLNTAAEPEAAPAPRAS